MSEYNKIKGRLLEMKITQTEAAAKMGIRQATLSQKLNNIRPITLKEANILGKLLHLSNEEYYEFFFAE